MILPSKTNFAATTLQGNITSSQATLSLSSTINFPLSGQFAAVIWGAAYATPTIAPTREIVYLTYASGNTFTALRQQEGTTESAWNAGDHIAEVITAATFNDYLPLSGGTMTGLLTQYTDVMAYGAAGDGITDDTTALTNFFNAAIARPGVTYTIQAKTYKITAQLPTINVSNVKIQGSGGSYHDVTPGQTGTIILWSGIAGGTMQIIAPTPGASAEHLSDIQLTGIMYNCNSLAAYGLQIYSVFNSTFDITVDEATTTGLTLGAVSNTFGETGDFQFNRVYYKGRQYNSSGVSLALVGTSSNNVSINDFWINLNHKNGVAMTMQGSDNNNFHTIVAFQAAGGSATESISVFGSNASIAQAARNERIYYLTSTLPLHAYGTGTYTYPAQDIQIFDLDVGGNSTPVPTVDTGASVYWKNDTTPFGDSPWVTYTPTVTATSGTFTTVSATGKYLQRGKITFIQIAITCTSVGTASGSIHVTVPFTENQGVTWLQQAVNNTTGTWAVADIVSSVNYVTTYTPSGTLPITSGQQLTITGFYGAN